MSSLPIDDATGESPIMPAAEPCECDAPTIELSGASPAERAKKRRGFTLIELLVVIAIIGLLFSLSAWVYIKQMERSHVSATTSVVQLLNDTVDDRVTAFFTDKTFVAAVPINNLADGTLGGGSATNEQSGPQGAQAQRAAIIARLHAMRGEFPQQFIDFMRADWTSLPAYSGLPPGDTGQANGITYNGLADPTGSRKGRTAIYQEYLKRTVSTASYGRDNTSPYQVSSTHPYNPDPSISQITYSPVPLRLTPLRSGVEVEHDPNTESTECLYLILTTSSPHGQEFRVDQIDKRFIADTDDDGLMEFVDSWGNPLRFYRWPTDYLDYLIRVDRSLPLTMANKNTVDPDGLLVRPAWFGHSTVRQEFEGGGALYGGYFRLHVLYENLLLNNPTVDLTADETDPSIPIAYPLIPMVVSSGPDGAGRAPGERWRAFGLCWPVTGDLPQASNLDARCARVGGYTPTAAGGSFTPDGELIEAVGDNIVSTTIRSGRGN